MSYLYKYSKLTYIRCKKKSKIFLQFCCIESKIVYFCRVQTAYVVQK